MKQLFFLFLMLTSCSKEPALSPSAVIDFRTTYTISGKVVWEHDDVSGVKDVTITLSGAESQTTITDTNGDYSFTVTNTGSYTVTPSKGINVLNGCTSADVTAIQNHVVLIAPINDPYKRIAADLNKNNTITTADATILNQAILGNPTALATMNPSWKFVDAAYTLILPPSNSGVPTGYPQSISFNLIGNVSGINFVGIKRGDVNGTANPQN
jgi:hypothetical protein